MCVAVAHGQPQQLAGSKAAISAGTSTADLATELPAPKPKSTVFGGEIHSVDSVQDKLTLQSAGMKPMKILFDKRTQYYVDGKKMPLRELRPTQHAAVQTALAGQISSPSAFMYSRSHPRAITKVAYCITTPVTASWPLALRDPAKC